MKRLLPALGLICVLLCLTRPTLAHDIRPAYLDIVEEAGGTVHITWRAPVAGQYAASLLPRLTTGWLDAAPVVTTRSDTMLVREWRVATPHALLVGATVSIDGLEQTITDVLLHIQYGNGAEFTQLLKPASPALLIPPPVKAGAPVRAYLWLGFTHIWGGFDHLLYVFGLTLLVRDARALLKTISAFTLAHSLTLAAAVLGLLHVPAAPVEACIALSILYVATELLRQCDVVPGSVQRAPWLIAFCFGLLHGLGFAGALSEIGLPARHIPSALLLFNVGIEIGQISFVALLLGASRALSRYAPVSVAGLRWAPPYVIGGLASFWLLQRLAAVFVPTLI